MILKELNAYYLCNAIIKNKDNLEDVRISLLENSKKKRFKIQIILNKNEKDEISFFSKEYGEDAIDKLFELFKKVKLTYALKYIDNDNLSF